MATRLQRGALLLMALGLLGCPEDRVKEPTRLVSSDQWVRVTDPASDVFAAMRPPDATCDDSGYYVEPLTQAFEVDTGLCDYLTVRQTAPVELLAGDIVSIVASHDALSAPTPSTGYVGLAIDGTILWEVDVPIPRDPEVFMEEVVIERDVPAGAEIQFHVHNHGTNTWELQSVMCAPPDADA